MHYVRFTYLLAYLEQFCVVTIINFSLCWNN